MSKPDDQLPKEFLSQLRESTDGGWQIDTSPPGPFFLPQMDVLESVYIDERKNLILVFRDKREKKRFELPVEAALIPQLYDLIATIYNNFEKIGKKKDRPSHEA